MRSRASPERGRAAFLRENDGRSFQSETNRYYQDESFLQTLSYYHYVLSFLKRKYERKQFGKCPETLLKVQGGAFQPRRLYQSKGGSIGSNLKKFLVVRSFLCLRGRGEKPGLLLLWRSANMQVAGGFPAPAIFVFRIFKALPFGELPTKSGERAFCSICVFPPTPVSATPANACAFAYPSPSRQAVPPLPEGEAEKERSIQ